MNHESLNEKSVMCLTLIHNESSMQNLTWEKVLNKETRPFIMDGSTVLTHEHRVHVQMQNERCVGLTNDNRQNRPGNTKYKLVF